MSNRTAFLTFSLAMIATVTYPNSFADAATLSSAHDYNAVSRPFAGRD